MKVKVTKYYCDLCGKELDQDRAEGDFLELPIVIGSSFDRDSHATHGIIDESLQVCNECLSKIAISTTRTIASVNDKYKKNKENIKYLEGGNEEAK